MTTSTTTPIELDHEFLQDPHAAYRLLREERPVTRAVTGMGLSVWVVTRYADVRAALNDPRLSKQGSRFGEILTRHSVSPERLVQFSEVFSEHMLNSDPPDHTRLRKIVNRAFTVRAIARMRERIEQIATGLADDIAARLEAGEREIDLLDAFAFPLPMTVICELLGVPEARRDDFRHWSNTLLSQGEPETRAAASREMGAFLSDLVESKREAPGEDMLSAIVEETSDADRLSTNEAVSMAFLLLVAGHETTVNLIGNGMRALLTHPEEMDRLREDLDLAPKAVEEFLRYDGPVNLATLRFTAEPVTIGGAEIGEGEIVMIALDSADRDPERYPDPDTLDLTRDTSNHVAFGYGIHHCLGAPLARLEGEVAFRTLVGRFPQMTLAAEPQDLAWRESTLIRGLLRLPVRP
ncbi:cytochrome P450 [Pseudonocardia sp. KRD291]|uniref:cytochrome P450 family protein n=1 Tax=Pseudonocardia sp. KRD291 TaxID=2792007 RepID=UPI001C4A308A|nr:cytochrome P450 [Pseudonocardia sp. KRD291]MBW0104191.1 cytochrome P450 [Pseudonocardia sp. KRD291]